jgi:hypothetical protein
MAMTKRIQIPIDEPELALVRAAASRAGQPVAEWARDVLREEAREQLGEARLDPKAALKSLFSAGAPVDDIETMIEESVAGRLR